MRNPDDFHKPENSGFHGKTQVTEFPTAEHLQAMERAVADI